VSVVDTIEIAARATGYREEAIVRDYPFADVLVPAATTRQVAFAAFTQTPPSYRSAAFALATGDGRETIDLVNAHRSLGAPLLFVVEGDDVSLWQVRSAFPARLLERLPVGELPALFKRNSEVWHPDAIRRAKSIGAVEDGYQLDFVDVGLLPAIEGEIHTKLDRLLVDALKAARDAQGASIDIRLLFRIVFRLLAAKVLQDRKHSYAAAWNPDDLSSVLQAIESYYLLPKVQLAARQKVPASFVAAWNCLRRGISFSNISSDDLAFVYENTLITPETRRLFGTHSTPRQVAEYIVQRMELHHHRPDELLIYEPFAGAGVFLVSALRHVRDLLPVDWTDQERHNFLINHISGDEIEPFACEVAKLSLILADYPNHNGWRIEEVDLFRDGALKTRMRAQNVILCNPPFEGFAGEERLRYPAASAVNSKPIAALDAALDTHPLALGFVLPRPFIVEGQFSQQRERIERLYENIEIVELPDRTFNASKIEAALLIARERRRQGSKKITLRSTEVSDRDRLRFLKTGEITTQRISERNLGDAPAGELWIPPLVDLWEYLSEYPKLKSVFELHLGARWIYDQGDAVSATRKKGFKPGIFSADDVRQFDIPKISFVDTEPSHLTHAIARDWAAPKIITNAVRLSRGPWRLAAAVDRAGLVFSQQLLGLWPNAGRSDVSLEACTAILSGPVANAFFATRYPSHRFRIASFRELPVPPVLPPGLSEIVAEYVALLKRDDFFDSRDDRASDLLTAIDAMVLEAYDLPYKLERQLLDLFIGADRPVSHKWKGWNDTDAVPGLRLAETLSGRFRPGGNWTSKVFGSLPEEEAAALRIYGE
jgi:hypothetical protein